MLFLSSYRGIISRSHETDLLHLRKFEQNYKEAEKERDALKKSTQQKFQRLTAKNQASDKLVSVTSFLR